MHLIEHVLLFVVVSTSLPWLAAFSAMTMPLSASMLVSLFCAPEHAALMTLACKLAALSRPIALISNTLALNYRPGQGHLPLFA